eukprot:9710953-Alexandrium_andersonii.AAC.1
MCIRDSLSHRARRPPRAAGAVPPQLQRPLQLAGASKRAGGLLAKRASSQAGRNANMPRPTGLQA